MVVGFLFLIVEWYSQSIYSCKIYYNKTIFSCANYLYGTGFMLFMIPFYISYGIRYILLDCLSEYKYKNNKYSFIYATRIHLSILIFAFLCDVKTRFSQIISYSSEIIKYEPITYVQLGFITFIVFLFIYLAIFESYLRNNMKIQYIPNYIPNYTPTYYTPTYYTNNKVCYGNCTEFCSTCRAIYNATYVKPYY